MEDNNELERLLSDELNKETCNRRYDGGYCCGEYVNMEYCFQALIKHQFKYIILYEDNILSNHNTHSEK